jgi:hypothetical protein
MADSLIVQGIEFQLLRGVGGTTVHTTEAMFSGATALVNQSLAGAFGYRDWINRVDSENRIIFPAFSYIQKVPFDQMPREAASVWRSRNKVPLPEKVCHVHIDQGYLVPAESWVPCSFLLELYGGVREERLAPEPIWLFRFPPLFWKPSSREQLLLDDLEQRARNTPIEDVNDLVDELQRSGLFDVGFASERADALRERNARRLLELQRAGLELVDYLYSPEHRAVRTPPDYVRSVQDSPVALSVFLSPTTPWPATRRHQWLADLTRSIDSGKAPLGYTVRSSLHAGKSRIDAISSAES